MLRAAAYSALFGLLLAGLGCRHVGGKCDCTNDPNDAVLPVPNNPYFPTATTGNATPAAPGRVMPMPVAPPPMKDMIPPAATGTPVPTEATPVSKGTTGIKVPSVFEE